MFVAIITSLVLSLLSFALMPKPPGPQNAVAGTLDIPTPPFGEPLPVYFGTVWETSPKVIYYGNKKLKPIVNGGGGK